MIELKKDIWEVHDYQMPNIYAICITTNGYTKPGCIAVMGRGTAAQAKARFRSIDQTLGFAIMTSGNKVRILKPGLIAFPVKPVSGVSDGQNVVSQLRHKFPKGKYVPGWAMKASLEIIERSLDELAELQLEQRWTRVYLPRPGCGAGELDWETVRPLCLHYADWLAVVTI